VIFHHLKGLLCFLTGKSHHHCNFTTAGKQALATKQAGFRDVRTIGRMSGLTRMLLRLPRGTGKPLVRAIERRSTQRYDQPIKKNLAAHLIVIGQK